MTTSRSFLLRFTADYGMLFVLLLLCGWYSAATWAEQHPTGAGAGEQLAEQIVGLADRPGVVLIVAGSHDEDSAFADTLRDRLREEQMRVIVVKGEPRDARAALQRIAEEDGHVDVIACTSVTAGWPVIDRRPARFADVPVIVPESWWWPNFLKTGNLLNIAHQIVVYAIIAIGMTMVIVTGGIDLSVGSLVALTAVVTALLIQAAGGESAGPLVMVLGGLGGVATGALIGFISGTTIVWFRVPAFIQTLAMMLVASGLAFILAQGQSIDDVPQEFVWLGRGAGLFRIPNAVVLMVVLYVLAHLLMSRTALGRYIYAVGGNMEAARLSGVPVRAVVLFVYTACGALAGLGGVITASVHRSGSPNFGQMYELYVIAAVVVGGTSLQGGQGKILGTLIGAFIIAVIQNGMNLTGVTPYTQKVVLGLVILGAVLLDMFKHRGWWWAAREQGASSMA